MTNDTYPAPGPGRRAGRFDDQEQAAPTPSIADLFLPADPAERATLMLGLCIASTQTISIRLGEARRAGDASASEADMCLAIAISEVASAQASLLVAQGELERVAALRAGRDEAPAADEACL